MKLSSQHPSLSELTLVTRQLALMIRAGIPITSALELLAAQKHSSALQNGLQSALETIVDGGSIAAGMRRSPHCFPPFYTTLVAAGEHAGILDQTLDTIAEQLEAQRALRSRMIRAAIYPAVVCATLAAVVLFLLTWVIPTFEDLFAESGVALPLLTRVVLQASHYALHYWLMGAVFLAVSIGLLLWHSSRTPKIRQTIEHITSRIPVWRSLLRAKYVSECSTLLAALTRVGIPLIEGLSITIQTIQSSLLRAELLRVRSEISEGRSLSAALHDSAYFPTLFSHLIEVGERSGQLEPMLAKAAVFYRAEVEQAIDALKQLIEPALIILIGVIVGTTVLAVYLPIFQMGELAGMR